MRVQIDAIAALKAHTPKPGARPVAHTPGPWRAATDGPGAPQVLTDDWQGCLVAMVATYPEVEVNPEQAKADARLIAAAPELLAALIEMEETPIRNSKRRLAAERQARAAIAKAMGESK